jgi:hypothetical protein
MAMLVFEHENCLAIIGRSYVHLFRLARKLQVSKQEDFYRVVYYYEKKVV